MKRMYTTLCLIVALVFLNTSVFAQKKESPDYKLITNANVWDGTSDKLVKADVLIENNLIKEV